MNLEQCEAIIAEIFEVAWPDISPDGRAPWSKEFIQKSIYPFVRVFPEVVAREAAAELAGSEAKTAPRGKAWASICRTLDNEAGRFRRTPCARCDSKGVLFYKCRMGEYRQPILATVTYPDDPTTRGQPGWYEWVAGCSCANRPAHIAEPDGQLAIKIWEAIRRGDEAFRAEYGAVDVQNVAAVVAVIRESWKSPEQRVAIPLTRDNGRAPRIEKEVAY